MPFAPKTPLLAVGQSRRRSSGTPRYGLPPILRNRRLTAQNRRARLVAPPRSLTWCAGVAGFMPEDSCNLVIVLSDRQNPAVNNHLSTRKAKSVDLSVFDDMYLPFKAIAS